MERIDLLVRAALHALAVMAGLGKVSTITWASPDGPVEVVNVDVTERPEQREQLADALITCDAYHVHDPECFPWERWTTDRGEVWRGMIGRLLTMTVRIEELIGHEPVASDPAAVPLPAPPTAPPPAWPPTYREPEHFNDPGPVVRPFMNDSAYSASVAAAAAAGRLGVAEMDGALSEPPAPEPAAPEPLHPLAELIGRAPIPVVPGDTAEEALRRWVGATIEAELRTGGPFGLQTDALAAVLAHPAAEMIDQETALSIAAGLVRPLPRQRRSWWTLSSILGGAE